MTDPSNADPSITANDTTVALTASNETFNLTASDSHVNITGTNDIVTIAGFNDVVALGPGDNKVIFTDGNHTVTLGTGTDSVTFAGGTNTVNAVIGAAATLHAGDTLAGGSGSDTLNLSGSGSLDLNSFNFSRFETVDMSAGEKLTLNGSSLTINGSAGGSDTFQFHANLGGNHTINNFVGSGSSHDTIDLDKSLLGGSSGSTIVLFGKTFGGTSKGSWLDQNVVASGSDVVIHDGNNTITVTNAKLSDVKHDIAFVTSPAITNVSSAGPQLPSELPSSAGEHVKFALMQQLQESFSQDGDAHGMQDLAHLIAHGHE